MDFEELGEEEKKLLLRSFSFDVDSEGYIIDRELNERLYSPDTKSLIKFENAGLIPGSLKIIDTTPLTISKFLREKIDSENGTG